MTAYDDILTTGALDYSGRGYVTSTYYGAIMSDPQSIEGLYREIDAIIRIKLELWNYIPAIIPTQVTGVMQ